MKLLSATIAGKVTLDIIDNKNRTRKQALELSIRKWETIAHYHKLGVVDVEEGGQDTCALCVKYLHLNCKGCPVMRKTNMGTCGGTPYRQYTGYKKIENLSKKAETFRIHAENEVVFLKSLRRLVK
jgi:hypothetical protein